jgi:hypothetical protein
MSRRTARTICWIAAASVSMPIAAPQLVEAGQTTYSIQNYPADQNGAALSGTITTDGVIGDLAGSDILSWSWTVTPTVGAPVTVSSSDAGAALFIQGSVVASQSSITIAAPADVSSLTLTVFEPSIGDFELSYERAFMPGQPELDVYEAVSTTISQQPVWETFHPAMGDTDPWVIAMAAAAVPEPSSLFLAASACACAVVLGVARNRTRFCRRPAFEARGD